MDKKRKRKARAIKTRAQIRKLSRVRLSIHKTPRHIYAQVISADGKSTIASVSSIQLKSDLVSTGNIDAAMRVGELIAKKSLDKGIDRVAFDRSGFKYHGRVKALADAARQAGLLF